MHFLKTRKVSRPARIACLLALSLFCLCSIASGQSTNIGVPAVVSTNEVLGSIAARDIGDSRLTNHYYVFIGTPGDLLITIESRNLNGDVDVFTLSGLRPLLKLTVYATSSSSVTKSIYLRKRERLILRIEGRSPNDDEATYRLYFAGSFEPMIRESPGELAENAGPATEPATSARPGKKGRRVSSVGARIDEPPPAEVAAAPTPEPSPAESPQPVEAKTEQPTEATRSEVTKAEVTRTPSRTARGRRVPGRRTPAPVPPKPKPAATEPESTSPVEATAEAKPSTTRRGSSRRSTTARSVAKPPPEPEPESGPRLLIETSDGTLIDRYMSSVRRVVVENGQVVVTGRDGKIERVPLVKIVRMSISP